MAAFERMDGSETNYEESKVRCFFSLQRFY